MTARRCPALLLTLAACATPTPPSPAPSPATCTPMTIAIGVDLSTCDWVQVGSDAWRCDGGSAYVREVDGGEAKR